jgi:hypothetical protein
VSDDSGSSAEKAKTKDEPSTFIESLDVAGHFFGVVRTFT